MLLFPALALAQHQCAEWLACPYVSPDEEPNLRYLSLVDAHLGFPWTEIEVDGNQALVCLSQPMPLGVTAGCTRPNQGQLRALLEPPRKPYFDGTQIQFSDEVRPFNQREIRRRIRDPELDDGILRERGRP